MKPVIKKTILAIIVSVSVSGAAFAKDTYLGRAFQESGKASVHCAKAVGNAAAGSGQVVAGSAAVPLMVSGKIGEASGKAGDGLMDAATSRPAPDAPLPVGEEVVSAGPSPDNALNPEKQMKTAGNKADGNCME